MPKLLTQTDHITIHPGEAGVTTVSGWFAEGRAQHEKATFAPSDYSLFCKSTTRRIPGAAKSPGAALSRRNSRRQSRPCSLGNC
jgi:hypothetical protein